jgi:signal peptidase I
MTSFAKGLLKTVVLCVALIFPVLIALILLRFFVQARYIPSSAMEPSLRINDRICLESMSSFKGEPYQRGTIVCFYPPVCELKGGKDLAYDLPHIAGRFTGLPFLPSEVAYIKRIIGTAGDRIRIEANDGVYVNGRLIDEPYISEPAAYSLTSMEDIGGRNIDGLPIQPYANNPGEIVVPKGMLFVLGDNRNSSEDSHVFGFVAESRVIGRTWFMFVPFYSYMREPNWTRPQ